MKAVYSKPDVFFESFSLSTSIAAGCEAKVETLNNGDCGIISGFQTVFVDSPTSNCTSKIGEFESWNGICYHNPSDDNNLFNS